MDMRPEDFEFAMCSEPGCTNTSAFSPGPRHDHAMTLRAGLKTCTIHTSVESVAETVSSISMNPDTAFIFYDIDITRTGEIAQLSAVSSTGNHVPDPKDDREGEQEPLREHP